MFKKSFKCMHAWWTIYFRNSGLKLMPIQWLPWQKKTICSKHKSMKIDLFSVKTIQTLTSYHARIPFKFHEAILRVNFRPSAVLASGLTSVGNEVSVPSGRVSMVSSFLGGAFFPFPPLPFCTQVVERYSVLHACKDL